MFIASLEPLWNRYPSTMIRSGGMTRVISELNVGFNRIDSLSVAEQYLNCWRLEFSIG